MKLIVKVFPEITIKSRPVRKQFIRQLAKNMRTVLKDIDPALQVLGEWDNLELQTSVSESKLLDEMYQRLRDMPGIAHFLEVHEYPLGDFDDILDKCRQHFGAQLPDRLFSVRCKRAGKHSFSSMEVEAFVGSHLRREFKAAGIELKNPQVVVRMEIRDQRLFIIDRQHEGLGGYPLGSLDQTLVLMSGGFDSTVAAYQIMRRGMLTHFCFFNLGGRAHELGVMEVAHFLWQKYGSSHRVLFLSVPFEEVLAEILQKVDNSQMGVVLKRMMLRAADRVAGFLKLEAMVTGECVAQVASQTIANLAIIDRVTDKLVLRPLITSDKQEIIDLARQIGTEEFSRHVPEYCGVISVRPTTRARLPRIEAEEALFNFEVLETAIQNIEIQMIDRVIEGVGNKAVKVEEVAAPENGVVIIDIRHPEEEEACPLVLPVDVQATVEKIPFYELRTRFSDLPQGRQYLLYCDRGIMSRLHASHLRDAGYEQVAVYRPPLAAI